MEAYRRAVHIQGRAKMEAERVVVAADVCRPVVEVVQMVVKM